MKKRAGSKLPWLFLALGLVVVASVELDVRLRENAARAIDFFGSDDDDTPRIFWSEDSGAPPIVPKGVPASFADLAERVSPGVVNISTERTTRGGHPLEQFLPPSFGRPSPSPQQVPSLGTGFVISPDGYIVTNDHVISDVDRISVRLEDGTELDAEIVGRDPKTDIALLRVETDQELFALPLGDSDAVRSGEWVVAIGNPFGLEHTVTAGIVSAKHRAIAHGPYDDYIQTDAAINPGNSGGPLINLSGEVIGINTAINPRANTIGFAVPVNMAKSILPQLRASGHVTRGWLGVVIQKITPELVEGFELEEDTGALVSRVIPDGPADEAGIRQGDVIREFGGKPIDEFGDLPRLVAETPVDEKVDVVVLRDGKTKTLRARIAELEEPREFARVSTEARSGAKAFGLRVQDLTPDLAEQLGVEGDGGVVISSVKPSGSAERAGIRRGDVIVEVDREEVGDVGDLEEQLSEADERALLLIRRGESQLYVPIERDEG